MANPLVELLHITPEGTAYIAVRDPTEQQLAIITQEAKRISTEAGLWCGGDKNTSFLVLPDEKPKLTLAHATEHLAAINGRSGENYLLAGCAPMPQLSDVFELIPLTPGQGFTEKPLTDSINYINDLITEPS